MCVGPDNLGATDGVRRGIPDILSNRLYAASTLSLNCIRLAHLPVGFTNSFRTTQTSQRHWRGILRAAVREGVFSVQMNWELHMSSKGTIKRIVSDKGFGFVADESGQEYFFHQSACQSFDSLREGQSVTFQTGQGPKGPRAENVREA
jgi:CspA family cold shock protein